MLTLQQLRGDKEAAIAKLAKKGVDAAPIIAKIEEADDRRKALQAELDACLAEQNKAAKEIGALMGQGRKEEAEQRKAQVAALKARSVELQQSTRRLLPSLTHRLSFCQTSRLISFRRVVQQRITSLLRLTRTTQPCRRTHCHTGSLLVSTTLSILTWA